MEGVNDRPCCTRVSGCAAPCSLQATHGKAIGALAQHVAYKIGMATKSGTKMWDSVYKDLPYHTTKLSQAFAPIADLPAVQRPANLLAFHRAMQKAYHR